MLQNDIDIINNQNKALEMKNKDLNERIEQLEVKLQSQKERALTLEKEKETNAIEYENKIEFLKYKLLNKINDEGSSNQVEGDNSSQFNDLLSICKQDLEEILLKLKQKAQTQSVEDQLRKELIEQGKKMNELRADHERKMYEISNENLRNTESQMQKSDASRKLILQKSKDEIAIKNEKIRTLEKNEKKSRQD